MVPNGLVYIQEKHEKSLFDLKMGFGHLCLVCSVVLKSLVVFENNLLRNENNLLKRVLCRN